MRIPLWVCETRETSQATWPGLGLACQLPGPFCVLSGSTGMQLCQGAELLSLKEWQS